MPILQLPPTSSLSSSAPDSSRPRSHVKRRPPPICLAESSLASRLPFAAMQPGVRRSAQRPAPLDALRFASVAEQHLVRQSSLNGKSADFGLSQPSQHLGLWQQYDMDDGGKAANPSSTVLTYSSPFAPVISPEREEPASVPSSPQSTRGCGSSTAHLSNTMPPHKRTVSIPQLCMPPPSAESSPVESHTLFTSPNSWQHDDHASPFPASHVATREALSPTPPPPEILFPDTTEPKPPPSTWTHEKTEAWLTQQGARQQPTLSIASEPSRGRGSNDNGRSAYMHLRLPSIPTISVEDNSSTVEDRQQKRRSVRVSRGVLRTHSREPQQDGPSFDTMAMQGVHVPWHARRYADDANNSTIEHDAVSARASSDIDCTAEARAERTTMDCSTGEPKDLAVLFAGDESRRPTAKQDDNDDDDDDDENLLSFAVLRNGQEGQFWVTQRSLNELTSARLAELCLCATAGADETERRTQSRGEDVQLHIVLSHQVSFKLGLSLQTAGLNLVPVEPWTLKEFPSMQFLLFKTFLLDIAQREGFVRLLCSDRDQALPSALTASRQFWQAWSIPEGSNGRHVDHATQTDASWVPVKSPSNALLHPSSAYDAVRSRSSEKAIQTTAKDAAAHAESAHAFLRSIRGLSDMTFSIDSVERALDSAQESVLAAFAEHFENPPTPRLRRPISAPSDHRRAIIGRQNVSAPLSSRFSEESERESLDDSSVVMSKLRRWNSNRNSGGPDRTTATSTGTHTPSGALMMRMPADKSDQVSVTSMTSGSNFAAKLSIHRQKLESLATKTVVRMRSRQGVKRRVGSGASHTLRRRANSNASLFRRKEGSKTAPERGAISDSEGTPGPTASTRKAIVPGLRLRLQQMPRSIRLGAVRPAPLDLSRTRPTRGLAKVDVVDDDKQALGDVQPEHGSTPSTASIILPQELCARLLWQKQQDSARAETQGVPTDVQHETSYSDEEHGRALNSMLVNDYGADAEMLQQENARLDRQSAGVEELDERDDGQPYGERAKDKSDTRSIRSFASMESPMFAGLKRLFRHPSASSSLASLSLATPPASPSSLTPSATTGSTLPSSATSTFPKATLVPFRMRLNNLPRLLTPKKPIVSEQIDTLPKAIDSSTQVVISPVGPRHHSHHATILDEDDNASTYDCSIETAARHPGMPLLLPVTGSADSVPSPHEMRDMRPATMDATTTQSWTASAAKHTRNKGVQEWERGVIVPPQTQAAYDDMRRSIETSMATWQAYTTANGGPSPLMSPVAAVSSSSPYASLNARTSDTSASTTPITPPAKVTRGWRRCDENMEPAMRDCVASLTGPDEEEEEESEEADDVGAKKGEAEGEGALATLAGRDDSYESTSSLSFAHSVPWIRRQAGQLLGKKAAAERLRRPSTSRSLDLLVCTPAPVVSQASTPATTTTTTMTTGKKHVSGTSTGGGRALRDENLLGKARANTLFSRRTRASDSRPDSSASVATAHL